MSKIIVVDTSVMISALIGSKGPAREVIRRCLKGEYMPLISNALFQELEDVSRRERIRKKCPLSSSEVKDLLHSFYSVCNWIPIYYLWRPNIVDEADNFLIELALAGNAAHVITNNISDLQNSELHFPELTILTPEQILRGENHGHTNH